MHLMLLASSSPLAPTITLGPTANVVVDGNSFFDGRDFAGTTYAPIDQVGALATLLDTTTPTTHANVARSGFSWTDLANSTTARDALLDPDKTNILVVVEHRNQASAGVYAGLTVAQNRDACVNAAKTYLAGARAAGWDQIVLCGTFQSDVTGESGDYRAKINDTLIAVNDWWRANWSTEAKVVRFVDFRADAPTYFDFAGYTNQGFQTSTATCARAADGTSPDAIHPDGPARAAMAQLIAVALTN